MRAAPPPCGVARQAATSYAEQGAASPALAHAHGHAGTLPRGAHGDLWHGRPGCEKLPLAIPAMVDWHDDSTTRPHRRVLGGVSPVLEYCRARCQTGSAAARELG